MQESINTQVTGIILAGGQGTRLFPLTQTRCKPAVGFGGKFRLIDIPVSNALNSGITDLFVISQYFVPHLQDHLTSTYHFDLFRKSQIRILAPEEHPLSKVCFAGSGDAVRKNLEELLKTPCSHFLILCGDQLYNIKTVRALSPRVRHKASYDRTLSLLRYVADSKKIESVKSGIMIGLGETKLQVQETIRDLYQAGCTIITIGHYLQADRLRLPIKAFISPEQFKAYEDYGLSLGIPHMYCGPFVRSSYNAKEVLSVKK